MLVSKLLSRAWPLLILSSCSSPRNPAPANARVAPEKVDEVRASSDVQLSEEQYVRLTQGVFEIVVPRLEDKDIVYQEKLPEHLLPFKLRKNPFRGIGTAF